MPPEDVNARIALLITTLLVLVTVFNEVIETSPKAREGPTALGLWMFSMLLFLFTAFAFHCALVVHRRRQEVIAPTSYSSIKNGLPPREKDNHDADFNAGDAEVAANGDAKKSKFNLVDVVALGVLFILFVIYIVVYVCLVQ